MFRRVIVTAAAVVALAGTATPALAAGGPVNVSATVNSTKSYSISMTGLAPAVNFPSGNPGTQVAALAAENYAVSTNDPAGMTLTVTPGSSSFGPVGNNTLAVQEMLTAPNGPGGVPFPGGTTPLTLDTQTGAGTWNYSENWLFNIPAGAPAGTYSESFTYLAVAN